MARRRVLGWVALLASAGLIAQGAVATSAFWTDREWGQAGIGTLACEESFTARGAGRVLSGSALTLDLDDVAGLAGVEVVHDGTNASVTPSGAHPVAGAAHAYADPLDLTVANEPLLGIGPGLVVVSSEEPAGALGQYAGATPAGTSQGAAGYLTSSGAIRTHADSGYPDVATISLAGLLGAVGEGDLLAGVADVILNVGAIAARAELDECARLWGGDVEGALTREYLAASLTSDLRVPALGALAGAVADLSEGLEGAVSALSGSGQLAGALGGATADLIEGLSVPLLTSFEVTNPAATLAVDTSALQALLTEPFGDDEGVLTIDPQEATIRVDLGALLGQAYPGEFTNGLNGLAPNTDILSYPAALTALTAALTGALDQWVGEVSGALEAIVEAIAVDVEMGLTLRLTPLGLPLVTVGLGVSVAGTLSDLEVDLAVPGVLGVVAGAVTAIVNALTADLGGVVEATVRGLLEDALAPAGDLPGLAPPIAGAVGAVYDNLFLAGVVGIRLNAQNAPAVPTGASPAWPSLPPGRYDVAALHLSLLGPVGEVNLDLARASVGRNCLLAAAPECQGT